MDNLTHTLFALTLARTPLGRAGRGTTIALVAASNAPDIDVVSTVGGAASYIRWHRGPTHGPLGVIGLGVATALIVWAVQRAVGRDPDEEPDAPLRMLVPIAIIGVLCHVLMDLPTSYGTRLLSPFDWRWFAVAWMPIVDVYLLFVLGAGLLFGQMSTAARGRNAAIVLVLMGVNYGIRATAHHQALEIAPRLFGPLLPQPCEPLTPSPRFIDYWPRTMSDQPPDARQRCLVQLVAMPAFFSPFDWRVIAHLTNVYEVHDVNVLDARFRRPAEASEVMWRTTLRVPNIWTPPVFAAARTDVGQTFLGFARLAAARSFVDAGGTATVRWNDMRFTGMRPTPAGNQGSPFSVVIRIAPDGQVVQQQVTP